MGLTYRSPWQHHAQSPASSLILTHVPAVDTLCVRQSAMSAIGNVFELWKAFLCRGGSSPACVASLTRHAPPARHGPRMASPRPVLTPAASPVTLSPVAIRLSTSEHAPTVHRSLGHPPGTHTADPPAYLTLDAAASATSRCCLRIKGSVPPKPTRCADCRRFLDSFRNYGGSCGSCTP